MLDQSRTFTLDVGVVPLGILTLDHVMRRAVGEHVAVLTRVRHHTARRRQRRVGGGVLDCRDWRAPAN